MAKKDLIENLTKIKGIGRAKAEAIYDNGFDSIEKISKATVKDFEKVNGITPAIAKNLVNAFKKEGETKKVTKKEPADKKEEKELKSPIKSTEEKKLKKPAQEKKLKKPAEEKPLLEKEKKEEKEEQEEEEVEVYKPKKKPKLEKEMKNRIKLRKEIKKRTPKFLREEWFRYKRIPKNWRRPDGITSKMRINLNYRPSKVRVGFRGPKEVRGLHSSGFEEVIIYNVDDLNTINPDTQAARIGSSVGTKKRIAIEKKAEELEIRILNL